VNFDSLSIIRECSNEIYTNGFPNLRRDGQGMEKASREK